MGLSRHIWFISAALVFLQLINGTYAWGKHGHYITCKIAEGYLTKTARNAVQQLLPESAEGELAEVCSWPDEWDVRIHRYWSRALHFVDTPDFKCNYQYCRDCHDSSKRQYRCVTGAIYNYTEEIYSSCHQSSSEVKYNLTEALMFLSHFVGDVHQPLHAGFTGDLGGNKIELHWFKRKANLHHVWDTEIIDTAIKRFYNKSIDVMIDSIRSNVSSDDRREWGACRSKEKACPDPYASESVNLACKYAYKNATPGCTLEDDYFLTRLPVVEKRLAQGGVRLASILNRIFRSCGLFSSYTGQGMKQLLQVDKMDEAEELNVNRLPMDLYSKLYYEDLVPECPP